MYTIYNIFFCDLSKIQTIKNILKLTISISLYPSRNLKKKWQQPSLIAINLMYIYQQRKNVLCD